MRSITLYLLLFTYQQIRIISGKALPHSKLIAATDDDDDLPYEIDDYDDLGANSTGLYIKY